MKMVLKISAGLWLAATALLAAEPTGFEQYQTIIERSPFGGLPGSAAPNAPQPSFAERYALVGIVREGDQLLAVIQDKVGNRSEYKAAGEMLGDIKIVSIEAAEESSKLVLQQGVDTATLTYPARSAAAAVVSPMTMPNTGAMPGSVPLPTMQPPPSQSSGGGETTPPRRRIPFRRGGE